MKKISTLLTIILLLTCSCEESVYDPYSINFSDFFPSSEGNYYYYNVSVTDTNGTTTQSGTRKTYYTGDTLIFSEQHRIKVDTFQLTGIQSVTHNYFRKDSYGVYNFVDIDTNGFYFLLPDSLRGSVSFPITYPILLNLIEENKTWFLFEAFVGSPQFRVLYVDAEVLSLSTQTISFQNTTRTTEVYKVKYNAKLTTNLNEPAKLYEVYAWFAKGIGPIKWEGDSELINFFTGAEIYPINTIVLEELESFKVK
jgi:hypothetical protein